MKKNVLLLLLLFSFFPWASALVKNDTVYMAKLRYYILANIHARNFIDEAQMLYKESCVSQNEPYRIRALMYLSRYYYFSIPDSFYHYYGQLQSSVLRQNNYDDYYLIRNWYIFQLIHDQKVKQAKAEIDKDMALAKKLKNKDYEDAARLNLALYYNSIKMNDEGFQLLENILAEMEARNASPENQINVLRELLRNASSDEKLMKYLHKLKSFAVEMRKKHIERYSDLISYAYVEYTYDRSLISEYLMPHKMYKEAKTALDDLVKVDSGRAAQDLLMQEQLFDYYDQTGHKEKALELSNSMLKISDLRKEATRQEVILKKRSRLLFDLNRYKEAYLEYDQYVKVHDSLDNASYKKDLVTLRSQLELNQLEIQNKQAALKVTYMMWGAVSLFLVIIILIVLVRQSKKNARRAEEQEKREAEATRRKLAFYANMNHEIRTPLNAIDGFSQLLVEENDPEMRRQQYEVIHNSNEMLQRLIAEVLDVSKLEAHSMTFFNKPCDLQALMTELHSVFKLQMPEHVELILRECKPLTIEIDRNRLTQVITNLFNNAVKHTMEGSIRFGYENLDDTVRFFVEDTGEGIPEDKKDAIFDKYVQLGSGTSGVGLGLSICQGIVEQMGGKIGVDSVFGKGSTFWFVVPITKIS